MQPLYIEYLVEEMHRFYLGRQKCKTSPCQRPQIHRKMSIGTAEALQTKLKGLAT